MLLDRIDAARPCDARVHSSRDSVRLRSRRTRPPSVTAARLWTPEANAVPDQTEGALLLLLPTTTTAAATTTLAAPTGESCRRPHGEDDRARRDRGLEPRGRALGGCGQHHNTNSTNTSRHARSCRKPPPPARRSIPSTRHSRACPENPGSRGVGTRDDPTDKPTEIPRDALPAYPRQDLLFGLWLKAQPA